METLTGIRLSQMNGRIKAEFTNPGIKFLVIEVCNACMERALLVHEEFPKLEGYGNKTYQIGKTNVPRVRYNMAGVN